MPRCPWSSFVKICLLPVPGMAEQLETFLGEPEQVLPSISYHIISYPPYLFHIISISISFQPILFLFHIISTIFSICCISSISYQPPSLPNHINPATDQKCQISFHLVHRSPLTFSPYLDFCKISYNCCIN